MSDQLDDIEYRARRMAELYDLLMKWGTRADGCYCPFKIYGIYTMFGLGPDQRGNAHGLKRQYDYYYIYALIDDHAGDVSEQLQRVRGGHAHPSDQAFWSEALDYFKVGDVFKPNQSLDELERHASVHLYYDFVIPSHDHDELFAQINQIEKRFRELRPDSNLEFSKPTANSGGCYVATAVYGSYDCPEVWTLRRYRDQYLSESLLGRSFIRLYYAISPTLVKWFGGKAWFNRMFRSRLDRMVSKLKSKGYESTPYFDRGR